MIKVVPRATSDKPNTWAEFVILNCSKSSSRMTDKFHPPPPKKKWFHEAGCDFDFFACFLIVPNPRHESLAGCVSHVCHANIKDWGSGRCVIVCDRGMHLCACQRWHKGHDGRHSGDSDTLMGILWDEIWIPSTV